MFKPGDIVETIDYERDIDLILPRTEMKLTRQNGEYWYGDAILPKSSFPRTILIAESNLRLKTE